MIKRTELNEGIWLPISTGKKNNIAWFTESLIANKERETLLYLFKELIRFMGNMNDQSHIIMNPLITYKNFVKMLLKNLDYSIPIIGVPLGSAWDAEAIRKSAELTKVKYTMSTLHITRLINIVNYNEKGYHITGYNEKQFDPKRMEKSNVIFTDDFTYRGSSLAYLIEQLKIKPRKLCFFVIGSTSSGMERINKIATNVSSTDAVIRKIFELSGHIIGGEHVQDLVMPLITENATVDVEILLTSIINALRAKTKVEAKKYQILALSKLGIESPESLFVENPPLLLTARKGGPLHNQFNPSNIIKNKDKICQLIPEIRNLLFSKKNIDTKTCDAIIKEQFDILGD